MTREEAIEVYNGLINTKIKEAFEFFAPELRESEDERIRTMLIRFFNDRLTCVEDDWFGLKCKDIIAWLEKQKEPHYTKRNALFDECVAKCDPATMKKVSDEVDAMLEKEQKPNIELIQRSWYMEGYHDGEFGKEPKWILKTGGGGPKHELNPKYGQPLPKQQVTEEQLHNLNEAIKSFRMDGCDRIADSLHSLYNCILKIQEQKPAEWGADHLRDTTKKISEDLEEEVKRYLCEECSGDDEPTVSEVARHFAEWQKVKMMEEAEECELYWDGDFLAIDLNMRALGYSERDKVKIIIVKEDNNGH